ncbi:MAG: universal stress protein [Myxococcaceae bacterium]|nr:universal stress protein [Myxococcaceae bacterium]
MRARRPAPFKHVFVATDFSKGAALALERAARLPILEGGSVTIAHVLSSGASEKVRRVAETLAKERLKHARQRVGAAAAAVGRGDIDVRTQLSRGSSAYVGLVRSAREAGADLVVIGRHGQRLVRDLFIGSTAERVLRAGELPVLVVSGKTTGPYRRPLFAVDLEDTCRSVVTTALRALPGELVAATMVHAFHAPFEGFITGGALPSHAASVREEYRRSYRDSAASELAQLQARLGDVGVRWDTLIRHGDPRLIVVREAARCQADLLAIGTHGRSGIAHALLGSVAEWVLRAATCDVLVARPARVSFRRP